MLSGRHEWQVARSGGVPQITLPQLEPNVLKFAREGIAGRGVAALESGAMCPTDSKSLEKLKPKHPDAL